MLMAKNKLFVAMQCLAVAVLCWSGISLTASAQDNGTAQDISGVVTDAATGEPLIGASVLIKDTSTGCITDLDGRFSLDAPAGTELVISCIGYEDFLYTVSTQSRNIRIPMKVSAEFLDEVVVVGYGSVKKANLSGAVDQVSSE